MEIVLLVLPALGVLAIFVGGSSVIFPERTSRLFGIKAGSDLAFVRAAGARDIFIGLVFLFFYGRGDRQALGVLCLFTAVVSFIDFMVTIKYGSKKNSYFHLLATFAIVVLGVWILRTLN